MKIETNRLLLRPYTEEDIDALARIFTDSETMSFWPCPLTREDARGWIERSIHSYTVYGFGRWPVILKETGEQIGDCGIYRATILGDEVNDLGWIFHRNTWHQGYATEAARAVIEYAAHTLGLETLHANIPWNHFASQRVAERLKMQKVGEFENPKNRNIRTFLYKIDLNRF